MAESIPDSEVKNKLKALSQRDMPERFDPAVHDYATFDHGGAVHRYRLASPLSEEKLKAFEDEWELELPDEYRHFLLAFGNGGAGPGYGIFALGREDDRELDETTLEGLMSAFDDDAALEWEGDGDIAEAMRGAMPIATEGCQDLYWLVVTGPSAGQIWRSDDGNIEPLVEGGEILGFRRWYERWLAGCAERFL